MTPMSSPCHQQMPLCSHDVRQILDMLSWRKSLKVRVLKGLMMARFESRLQRLLGKLWQRLGLHQGFQRTLTSMITKYSKIYSSFMHQNYQRCMYVLCRIQCSYNVSQTIWWQKTDKMELIYFRYSINFPPAILNLPRRLTDDYSSQWLLLWDHTLFLLHFPSSPHDILSQNSKA